MGKYVLFQDKKKEWRFHLKANNGKIILSSEGYKNQRNALNGIDSIKVNANSNVHLIEIK